MAWIRPIYNKTATSFQNVSDIKRNAGNIDYIIRGIKGNQSIHIPIDEDVFQRIKRLEDLNENDLMYASDFQDIFVVIDYLIELFASIRTSPVLELPDNIKAKIDFVLMNKIENILYQFNRYIISQWYPGGL